MKAPEERFCNMCYREGKAKLAIFSAPNLVYLTDDEMFTIGMRVDIFDNRQVETDQYGRALSHDNNRVDFCVNHWQMCIDKLSELINQKPTLMLGAAYEGENE